MGVSACAAATFYSTRQLPLEGYSSTACIFMLCVFPLNVINQEHVAWDFLLRKEIFVSKILVSTTQIVNDLFARRAKTRQVSAIHFFPFFFSFGRVKSNFHLYSNCQQTGSPKIIIFFDSYIRDKRNKEQGKKNQGT